MKNIKLPLIILTFLLPILGVLYYYLNFDQLPADHGNWETIYKNPQGEIVSHLSTPQELKANNLPAVTTSKPVSTFKTSEWKKRLGVTLLRFQKPETKVIIKIIKMVDSPAKDQLGRYYQVVINYQLADGGRSSFSAIVSESSGQVVKSWNRTINEDYGKKNRQRLTPTGTL
ncbi:MAG: hypothetical protein HN353_07055 [Bdellovibrionales bacterium]|nr:hypothetical protein [Bdellovibrionales bacterium]MBT3525290.1 hypothetical protein [Bdellovibrionales bacterium]MBT7668175.1 hypothetical protein [Bdellovibrionales bacterium]MBT7767709.1 hypothetical protein [Bdellovibrionales bacterium]